MAESAVQTQPSEGDAGWPRNAESRIDRISTAELDVVVVLGKASMTLEELLTLEPGQLVETDRKGGQPLDVLVNGRLFCRGEVVVIRDQLAIRVTDFPKKP